MAARGGMEGHGIFYCVLKDRKIEVMTAYEDPTPFVEMAMQGGMEGAGK